MRRYVCLMIIGVFYVSCGLQEIGEHPKADDVWVGPGASVLEDKADGLLNTIWYVTGFDYPSGYDWRSDSDAGSVKCSLTVFVNAVPMLKVPVGEKYKVSAASSAFFFSPRTFILLSTLMLSLPETVARTKSK